jgi:hypothetical protein
MINVVVNDADADVDGDVATQKNTFSTFRDAILFRFLISLLLSERMANVGMTVFNFDKNN